jgi:hypothetical protein
MNPENHKPYVKPKLEAHSDWKAVTGAPISVPITGFSTDPSNTLESLMNRLQGE